MVFVFIIKYLRKMRFKNLLEVLKIDVIRPLISNNLGKNAKIYA